MIGRLVSSSVLSGLVLAVLVIGSVASDAEGPFFGLCYSPFRQGQSPETNIKPSRKQIREDLILLRKLTSRLRLYGLSQTGQTVIAEASKLDFEILAGLWIGPDELANEREIGAAIELSRRELPGLKTMIVGSEALLRQDVTPDHLVELIRRVRRETGLEVAYADIASFWSDHPAADRIASEVDHIVVHIYPFWDGVGIEQAPAHFADALNQVRKRYPDKTITVGETGWPADGQSVGNAIPSPENQATWVRFVFSQSQEHRIFFFAAFDETWKVPFEGSVGAHWGIHTIDRTIRPALVPELVGEEEQ